MLLVTSLLIACTNRTTYVINTSCDGFTLIKASRNDTTETLRQVKAHNDTYRAICEVKDGTAN
ncbi:hypothetical protein BTV66_11620 [Pasteurella multocida subsp. septica]|nr:hypothetical protein [Pasteurella multocida]ARA69029.1 hypothetical protein BTV67_00045 [Pasteurella multocida subsp. multocida]ARA88715.1 hypothetical protein BTV66_03440 [Pasteurella multocida subsp. septica]ARA69619.1 hypothetical protein BTV67_03425 [Pasteurella multocida subsp. multocida]ARA70832.1 hypothetical protein BTV67_10060 [Pasteurella multocida subsp. multocida]ARA70912.1 hypothetical protein BTV67_10250 [Pasteurella multocida subsp. multocida]